MTRYTYDTTVELPDETEADVRVTHSVWWGTPETGRFGAPEDYDPGAPSEVEDVQIVSIEGHPEPDAALVNWVKQAIEADYEEMIREAYETRMDRI